MELDLSKMLGSRYRGDFEKRGVIEEIISLKKGAILFIDEFHTLVGAGSTEGSLDASNMFKPALARVAEKLKRKLVFKRKLQL